MRSVSLWLLLCLMLARPLSAQEGSTSAQVPISPGQQSSSLHFQQSEPRAEVEPSAEQPEAERNDGRGKPVLIRNNAYNDLLDVPGRVIGSKRIIPVTQRTFRTPAEWTCVERGADYMHMFPLAEDLQLKGVLIGKNGQAIRKRVKVITDDKHEVNVWVVLETVSQPGTVVTAVIYISDTIDPMRPPVENIRKNRWLAENAFTQAVKEWEDAQTEIQIGYAHYVFDKKYTPMSDEE